jgi:hypothetical protein
MRVRPIHGRHTEGGTMAKKAARKGAKKKAAGKRKGGNKRGGG